MSCWENKVAAIFQKQKLERGFRNTLYLVAKKVTVHTPLSHAIQCSDREKI